MEDRPDVWMEICHGLTLPDAEQFALVLAAAGIDCRLVALDGAVTLAVARPDADRARREVASYARAPQPSAQFRAQISSAPRAS